jgi:hypothetical protein
MRRLSPLGQLVAFIHQRIRHVYRRQWTSPFPCRTAKSRHQSQLSVDALDVTHARIVDPWAVAALHLQIPTWLA